MSMEKVTDIEIYLNDIAEKLYNGHASLLVGAGFSMNAQCDGTSSKKFPSWSDLGDCFYKKVHGSAPSEDKKCYLDVLKLAEEVEATFGRKEVNNLLEAEIPNKQTVPSELHTKLMNLPWSDVFTTNYDTLLERAAERSLTENRKYDIITEKTDIPSSTKPRIVKLHGCFQSHKSYIITRDDYRKYPTQNAAFVNLVRQSFMENTVCLIGFSGNDPNFLEWIGWVRDNLEEYALKIYFIGFSITSSEEKWMNSRNITPINISTMHTEIDNKTNQINNIKTTSKTKDYHYNSISYFLKVIQNRLDKKRDKENDKGAKINIPQYPLEKPEFYIDDKKDLSNQFKEIIEIWKQTREEYPNWLILPKESRDKLYELTHIYCINKINNLEPELAFTFLYEFNWRIEKCLFPILNEWIQYYETAVSKYNPFPKIFQIENANTPQENDGINWESITSCWIELQLSMLRYYREENIIDKWNELAAKIDCIKNELSAELLASYCYERCLYFMFVLDISSVRKELDNWPANTALPYWEAKRAGLMAELGDTKEAEKILETSLNEVRNRLKLKPINNDYLLISQESYILQLLQYVKKALYLFHNPEKLEETKEYSKRWNTLAQYKCDPWGELKIFKDELKTDFTVPKEIDKQYNFEIGHTTNTAYFHGNNNYVLSAYSFFRYIEETGIPLKINSITFDINTARHASACLANYSTNWAIIFSIRTGDKNSISNILNRRFLSFCGQQECDKLAKFYLEILIKSSSEIQKCEMYNNENFAISLSSIIPDILSRLCSKCNYEIKYKLLRFLKNIYLSDSTNRLKYKTIDKLMKRLIQSFSHEQKYLLIPEMFSFPPIIGIINQYPDPFSFIEKLDFRKKIKIEPNIIDKYICFLTKDESIREIAATRLITLYQCNILTKNQQRKLAKALWDKSKIGTDGFPTETNYYNFSFIMVPHPKDVNPKDLLRNYIERSELPIQANNKTNGINITRGRLPLFQDIIGTTYKKTEYIWQAEDINNLAKKFIDWWNADKEYLKDTRDGFMGSYSEEFKARFKNMINVFSQLFVKYTSQIDPSNQKAIQTLLDELSEYNMEDLEAKSSFISIFPESKRSLYREINKKLYSKNENEILDALNAVLVLVEQRYEDTSPLINSIIENIKNRKEPGLDKYIETLNELLSTNKSLFTEEVLSELQIGFEYLYDEISIQKGDSEEDVHLKLLRKSRASRFLVTLKKYYIEELKIKLPTYISQWEELCLNVDEFCEIRNIWLNGNAN